VPAVLVDAIVLERNGKPVVDINRSEFEIFEDGEPREISYFAATETPRSMLLLFDLSGSTDAQRPFMVQAFNVFLAGLRPQDRVSLASFAASFQVFMKWRGVVEGKPRDVQVPPTAYYSNVYRAIEDATSEFKNEKARKGIVVMTDGRDTPMFQEVLASRRIPNLDRDGSFRRLVETLTKRSIPIYFIALNTDLNPFEPDPSIETTSIESVIKPAGAQEYLVAVRQRLERIADATGGSVLYPKTLPEVVPLYETIGRELGASYSLGFAPKKSDGVKPRRIEVRVRREGVRIIQSRDSF
jgi:VWFA-related protein